MKYLYFCCFLVTGFFFIFLCYVMYVGQNTSSGDWKVLFICGGMTLLFFWGVVSEEKEPEETPTVTNIDKPKESDDVVVVTEIQGERKIIKNGKVIYSEKLKADELQVYEKLKDKN